MMYAIKAPSGMLLCDTASTSRSMAWDALFERHLGRRSEWIWVTASAFVPKCRRHGYRCVPVVVTETRGNRKMDKDTPTTKAMQGTLATLSKVRAKRSFLVNGRPAT